MREKLAVSGGEGPGRIMGNIGYELIYISGEPLLQDMHIPEKEIFL